MLYKLKTMMNNKKLVFTVVGGIVGILVLIIGIFVVIAMINKKVSYSDLESQLIKVSTKYLQDHPEMMPTEDAPLLTLDGSTLVAEEYIKDLNKLTKDNCIAEIEITYQNEGVNIKPFLTCDKYETSLFIDKVKSNNSIVSVGNGLYDLNEMLVFRGDTVNNYVKFNNLLWRIVKMHEDGTIYMILANVKDSELTYWDDRYNTTEQSSHGINDYTVSRVKDSLERIYTSRFHSVKSKLLPMNLCIGKRSNQETINDSSIECSITLNDSYIGLLPLYDYINASTDYNCNTAEDRGCANYNYLLNKEGKWWTITADGSVGTKVYGINYSGVITSDYANTKKYLRYIIALDGNSIYNSGDGTSGNPYTIR